MTATILGTRKRWQRALLVLLLAATAALYLWNITVNGMGNAFYAAAVQAGSHDWKALLFGSLDQQNFITVDKPPLAMWVMGASGRLFGFGSASMLIPEALMAVGSVALTYAAVTRVAGRWAGLLAGFAVAVTPVAVLMFRYNNPDAAMVFLMTAAAYCTVRALQSHGGRWMALAGAAVGLAFLAKMLEGVMVVPAVVAAYLLAAPVSFGRRAWHVALAGLAAVAASGWYVALTLLWPASARPYLAGSADDNFMNLVLGYNGLARVLGRNDQGFGALTGGAQHLDSSSAGAGFGGYAGLGAHTPRWMRLVSGEFGFEIGWLLPVALAATLLVLVLRWRAPRTDLVRAAAVLFGGWFLVDAAVLTMMHGMIHPYYTLSIATPVAVMFALAVQQLWLHRGVWWGRAALAAVVLGTGALGWWLLEHTSGWAVALRWTILAGSVAAAGALLGRWVSARPLLGAAALAAAVTAMLVGPAAYSVATVDVAHRGGGPVVGPARGGHDRTAAGPFALALDSPELDDMLKRTDTRWSAAVIRSSTAAGLELSTGTAVMAIGGFTGSDPAPTLQQFQDAVAHHEVGYYVATSAVGKLPGFGARTHQDIATWVAANYAPTTVGRATVYDLSAGLPHQAA